MFDCPEVQVGDTVEVQGHDDDGVTFIGKVIYNDAYKLHMHIPGIFICRFMNDFDRRTNPWRKIRSYCNG